jgi:hypothetical protein
MAQITPPAVIAQGAMLFNCTLNGSKVQNAAENTANRPKWITREVSESALLPGQTFSYMAA